MKNLRRLFAAVTTACVVLVLFSCQKDQDSVPQHVNTAKTKQALIAKILNDTEFVGAVGKNYASFEDKKTDMSEARLNLEALIDGLDSKYPELAALSDTDKGSILGEVYSSIPNKLAQSHDAAASKVSYMKKEIMIDGRWYTRLCDRKHWCCLISQRLRLKRYRCFQKSCIRWYGC